MIERCTRKFRADPRYKSDLRYLKIWIAYVRAGSRRPFRSWRPDRSRPASQADRLDDSRDVFAFLEQNGIGTTHALFYLARAIVAEQQGDYSLAASCYETALERRAEPRAPVEKKQYHFLRRMRSMWREYCAERSTRGGAALTDAETAAALASTLARGTADGSGSEDGTSRVALNRLGQWRARQEATTRRATATRASPQHSARAVPFRSGAASGRSQRAAPSAGPGANAGGGAGFVIHDDAQRSAGAARADPSAPRDGAGWSDFGTRVRQRARGLAPLYGPAAHHSPSFSPPSLPLSATAGRRTSSSPPSGGARATARGCSPERSRLSGRRREQVRGRESATGLLPPPRLFPSSRTRLRAPAPRRPCPRRRRLPCASGRLSAPHERRSWPLTPWP